MAEDTRRALVGGDPECSHPSDCGTVLGAMGTATFRRCRRCGGVVVRWPPGSHAPDPGDE